MCGLIRALQLNSRATESHFQAEMKQPRARQLFNSDGTLIFCLRWFWQTWSLWSVSFCDDKRSYTDWSLGCEHVCANTQHLFWSNSYLCRNNNSCRDIMNHCLQLPNKYSHRNSYFMPVLVCLCFCQGQRQQKLKPLSFWEFSTGAHGKTSFNW